MRVQPTEYPKLKKVGSMTYVGAAEALRFPALEEVTGSMEITTSFVNGMYPHDAGGNLYSRVETCRETCHDFEGE